MIPNDVLQVTTMRLILFQEDMMDRAIKRGIKKGTPDMAIWATGEYEVVDLPVRVSEADRRADKFSSFEFLPDQSIVQFRKDLPFLRMHIETGDVDYPSLNEYMLKTAPKQKKPYIDIYDPRIFPRVLFIDQPFKQYFKGLRIQ